MGVTGDLDKCNAAERSQIEKEDAMGEWCSAESGITFLEKKNLSHMNEISHLKCLTVSGS